MALLPLMAMAQARIGIVNSQQLFELMPEKAAAEAQLKALSDRYHAEYARRCVSLSVKLLPTLMLNALLSPSP